MKVPLVFIIPNSGDHLQAIKKGIMEILHILIRVSTQIQEDDGTSLKTQQEQGIDLSKKLKMKYQIHNEGGTSSNKDTLDDRPIMVNLLNLMDQGKIKHLFVYNTDRISRNQTTWYLIRQKMVKNEVILYTRTKLGNENFKLPIPTP